jgi:hypothetical protein
VTPDFVWPDNAAPPRLLSPAHPNAEGTLGPAALSFANDKPMHLGRVTRARAWQEFVLNRALETNSSGELCWRTVIISAPRQVGKSVLERVVCAWRLHSAKYFGQSQDVLHVAHKIPAAMEVWRPAARWAQSEYGRNTVRWGMGTEKIELEDGSRWLIQAANDNAGVAFSLSMALVDEAWKVNRSVVDGGLRPTLAEAVSPQLWLVSTAGTSASDLMASYRGQALAGSESIFLAEWSAPPDTDLDISDPTVWRAAAPHWDTRREERIREAFETADEWTFRQQWLNQWIPHMAAPVVGTDLWANAIAKDPIPDGARISFGIDAASDRSHAAIVAADGQTVELVEMRPDVSWLAGRVVELVERWNAVGVAYDQGGPAQPVADTLRATDVGPLLIPCNGREMSAASANMFDRLVAGTVKAMPSNDLSLAVGAAKKRSFGQSWIFARENSAASGVPLLAACLALYAAEHSSNTVEMSAIW